MTTGAQGELFATEPGESAARTVRQARVAVAVPVDRLLSYRVPDRLAGDLRIGHQVRVPLGGRTAAGFVVDLEEGPDDRDLRDLLRIEGQAAPLTPGTLDLGLWVAEHYGAVPGEALRSLVPAPVRRRRTQRTEARVSLASPEAVHATLEEHADSAAWKGRLSVLRVLGGASGPLRIGDLCRRAGTSVSPVRTLERHGLVQIARASAPAGQPAAEPDPELRPPTLSRDQQAALDRLTPLLDSRRFASCLLHGVTGSGKTEIYLRLIEATLRQDRSAILLVPEIALTPQTRQRIASRVKDVAVLHSNQSEGDRARQWQDLRAGRVRVAVGPRSAIFAPLEDLGLIVIDEEHENAFKQQQAPRYHARDVARRRAELENALLLMGTATPSLETAAACRAGDVTRVVLPERIGGKPLPMCSVIDMRREKTVGRGIFSRPLHVAVEDALRRKQQVLLYLNRRGFSTAVLCRACGWRALCPACDINLTHYVESARLLCHYCAHEERPPRSCPDCGQPGVLFEGVGTERVASTAADLWPAARVVRMDGETLRRRGAAERIFAELASGAIDILVGTQVVAKGLDIPGISLVGVISADTALLVPDFRSAERTFQLLCQVAGRAGRGPHPGRVLVQTWSPGHYAIQAACAHDFDTFAEAELQHRRVQSYPPFGHLLRIVLEGPGPDRLREATADLQAQLKATPAVREGDIRLMGPAPCPIPFMRNLHRQHLILHSRDSDALTDALTDIPRRLKGAERLLIDRDPVNLM